jgi:hypothetical protein
MDLVITLVKYFGAQKTSAVGMESTRTEIQKVLMDLSSLPERGKAQQIWFTIGSE